MWGALLFPWLPSVLTPLPLGSHPRDALPLSFKDTSRGLWLASPNHLLPTPDFFPFLLKNFYLFIFGCVGSSLLLHGLSLVVVSRDDSLVVEHGLLTAVVSLVAEHQLSGAQASVVGGSWAPEHRLNSGGAWAQLPCSM